MTMFAEFSKFVLSISVSWSVFSSGLLGIDENLVIFFAFAYHCLGREFFGMYFTCNLIFCEHYSFDFVEKGADFFCSKLYFVIIPVFIH